MADIGRRSPRLTPSPHAEKLSMSAADWLLLIFLSMLWGGSFFLAKVAVEDLPPLTLALGRVAIAAAILAVLARVTGESLAPLASAWPAFTVLGLLNSALPFTLIFWGQTHIASSLASILNATTPIFTALVAHFATRDEKLTAAKLVGIGAGFGGRRGDAGSAPADPSRHRPLGATCLPGRRDVLRGGRRLWPPPRPTAGHGRVGGPTDRCRYHARADRGAGRPAGGWRRRPPPRLARFWRWPRSPPRSPM
jgi:uncharacterized membrane protein